MSVRIVDGDVGYWKRRRNGDGWTGYFKVNIGMADWRQEFYCRRCHGVVIRYYDIESP